MSDGLVVDHISILFTLIIILFYNDNCIYFVGQRPRSEEGEPRINISLEMRWPVALNRTLNYWSEVSHCPTRLTGLRPDTHLSPDQTLYLKGSLQLSYERRAHPVTRLCAGQRRHDLSGTDTTPDYLSNTSGCGYAIFCLQSVKCKEREEKQITNKEKIG